MDKAVPVGSPAMADPAHPLAAPALLAACAAGIVVSMLVLALPLPGAPAGLLSAAGAAYGALVLSAAGALLVALLATRRHLENSRRTEARGNAFSILVESVKDAVVRYNGEGRVAFVSRSAEKLFGCRRFELDGTGLFERIHVMDRPAYGKALSDAHRGGAAAEIEIRMRRDGGLNGQPAGHIWVEVSFSPVVEGLAREGSWEVVAVLRDVSARRHAEDAMQEARRQAEEASEAKSRFLATIGHELRTPLNAIVGFSDMMQAGIGGTLSPGHFEYAGLIKQSGHHLLDVVNMLLDMSKIEAGKFELHTELFAPSQLVAPCLQLIEKEARDRNIGLRSSISANLPQIMGDERACRQVLINLLSNAVKFSRDGGTIVLAMKRQGRMLAISVSDTGIGMGPETLRRIGEPFLQAETGLARGYQGTGLGLSIVKGLVSLHGGQLHVVSENGAGTVVTVLLPIEGPAFEAKRATPVAVLHKDNTDRQGHPWAERERKSAAL